MMSPSIARIRGIARQAVFGIAVAFALTTTVLADFSSDLAGASAPVPDVPEVAIFRLTALLAPTLPADQRRLVTEKIVEALVRANRPAEALGYLQDGQLQQTATGKFWSAQVLAALGRWNEALSLYQAAAQDSTFPQRGDAAFGTADALRALNRIDQAAAKLSQLVQNKEWQTRAALRLASLYLDKGDTQAAGRTLERTSSETPAQRKLHRFLRGRLEMAQHHPDRALVYFEPLTKKPREVSRPLIVATLFAIADAHRALKTPETGDDFLEDFIDHHPNDPALPDLFGKLDELYRAEKKPVRAELERWTREPDQLRRGLAQWYLARIEIRNGRPDRARQLLTALRLSHANMPELAGGLVEFADLEMQDGHFAEVIAIAEDASGWRPSDELARRLEFLVGRARYATGDFKGATATFEDISKTRSPFTTPALYNLSLGWLQLGDHARFAAAASQVSAQGGSEDDRADMRLQEALLQARQQKPEAADTLRKFIADFPKNARLSEAWVALAELTFHQDPSRTEEANKLLAQAAEAHPTAAAKERAQYLSIWIEDAGGRSSDKVINLAKDFLAQQPASGFAGDVRLKLAETYYLRQDFANAQTNFELFAQQNPNSPLTEKALFFGAESAMASMAPHTLDRAITLFDQVAQMKGDLRWAARNEQALIERKLGKPQDALLLYDEVLRNDARPGEKREAVCGKGDIYFELSASDPKNYERAIDAYDQLAANANEPGHWHNQALFKKGVCLEKKSDRAGALATFYEVLEKPFRTDRAPELFWYYKAGFNAARLLEADSHWDSAAKVYQKLAAAGGSRSEEARVRLNQLRLEHFLWSD